jgi:PAS domain S-box-containing protein
MHVKSKSDPSETQRIWAPIWEARLEAAQNITLAPRRRCVPRRRIATRHTRLERERQYFDNLKAANLAVFEYGIAAGELLCDGALEWAAGTPDGLGGFLQTIVPEDRDAVILSIRRAIETRESFHFECRQLRGDGTAGWLEGKGRVRFDEAMGEPDRIVGVCMDITDRKRYEQTLARLAAIVDSSDDAIISVTNRGEVLSWNPAAERIYGYSAGEMIGRSIKLMVPPEAEVESDQIDERLRRGEAIQHFETVRLRKDRKPIHVSMTLSPIRDNRGAITGASGIVRDITERKAFEEQLRQTAKLESIGVLAGGIAHDFNNLLAGIIGNASLIQEIVQPDSPLHPLIADVIAAGERAANLTRQLLAYSGQGKFLIKAIDLSEVIRRMQGLIHSSISRTVKLTLQLGRGLPLIIADEAQMQQLVMNLVINAAEAMGERTGEVTVETGVQDVDQSFKDVTLSNDKIASGKYARLQVKDNGSGMDEQTIDKMFDPFFTTKFTGRGLGLSAVLGLVHGHKGLIGVDSKPGRGSTFTILIPAARLL